MKTVGINTELSAWILDKPKTGKLFPKTGITFPESGKTFPETVDTQDYNKNNIKRSSSRNSKESRNGETLKFLSRHPEAVDGVYTSAGKSWEQLTTSKPHDGFSTNSSQLTPPCQNRTGLNGQIPSV